METNQDISSNYSELIYSSLPIIEKLYKKKTGSSYYRAYSGEYYVDFDWTTRIDETGTEEYVYYAWFSKDGINVEKKVELEEMGNGGIGGVYTGNGITIAMGTPNMALSEYQRPAGFNSGCIYIFDEDCKLISTETVTGLQSCIGFYNNYFYFTTKTYTSRGEATVKYTKSADCKDYIDITREEFQEAVDSLNAPIHKTAFGNSVSFDYYEDGTARAYLSNADDAENKEVVYESANNIERSDIAISSDLSGSIVRSKYRVNILSNDKDYMTVDYVYKMCLPEIDQTKVANPNSRCIWATDDFVYIDQDIEYILRIPMTQFEDKVYVQLNDKILGFSQPPVMEDDRTLVPMRFLFEQMGAEVEWNDSTQTATATVPMSTEQQMMTFSGARGGGGERNVAGDTNSVTFSIDDTNATVNGEAATMDVLARLINDQTFVPLRFLSENLGYDVEWDEASNTAIITTE